MIRFKDDVETHLRAVLYARERYKNCDENEKMNAKTTVLTITNNLVRLVFCRNRGPSYWRTLDATHKEKLANILLIKDVNIAETASILKQIKFLAFGGKEGSLYNEIFDMCAVKISYRIAKSQAIKLASQNAIDDIDGIFVKNKVVNNFLLDVRKELGRVNLGANKILKNVAEVDPHFMPYAGRNLEVLAHAVVTNLHYNGEYKYTFRLNRQFLSAENKRKEFDWLLGEFNVDPKCFKFLTDSADYHYERQRISFNGDKIYFVVPHSAMNKKAEKEAVKTLMRSLKSAEEGQSGEKNVEK